MSLVRGTAPPVEMPRRARAAGIGELLVGLAADGPLTAHGLGSCVVLTAWDPVARVAGLAHFMLPSGTLAGAPVKYLDSGLPRFLAALTAAGARPQRCRFTAAGGAAMLLGSGAGMDIGRRNIAALHSGMAAAGLALDAQDLGGARGRSIELDPADGRVTITTMTGSTVL